MNWNSKCEIKQNYKLHPRLPPLVAYIAMLVIGLIADYFYSFPIVEKKWSIWIGSIIAICGIALHLYSIYTLKRAGTTFHADKSATVLVDFGPYRVSRNPIYIALGLIYIGISFVFNNAWSLILVVPVFIIIHFAVVKTEEVHLYQQFGEDYKEYTRRVSRWI